MSNATDAGPRPASRRGDASTSPVDTQSLLARCLGNLSFALSLLSELEATGAERVEEIARFAARAQFAAAADAAHALKGAVAIVGAEPLRQLAAQIEAAGRAGAGEQLGKLVQQLGDEMQRCLEFIPAFRANRQGC